MQDTPEYSKLVFITYDHESEHSAPASGDRDEAMFIAIWLYQRLKYAGFPVRTYLVDEAIGGSGFGYHSILAASPMLAVISAASEGRISRDIKTAIREGREIITIIAKNGMLADDLADIPSFDFSVNHRLEAPYQRLKALLCEREYPVPKRIYVPDGDSYLELARQQYDEYANSTNEYKTDFFFQYYYMNVFRDTLNKRAKVAALNDLGNHRILSGLVLAAFQDDPQDDVRAAAAFALAKFRDPVLGMYLYELGRQDHPLLPSLYARVAHLYQTQPNIVSQLRADLQSIFAGDLQVASESSDVLTSNRGNVSAMRSADSAEYDVFISYAHRDADKYAVQLAEGLGSAGFDVWIDSKLEPGLPVWTHAVEEALRKSAVLVVLVSPSIHQSEWVEREVYFASTLKKPVIPINVLRTDKPFALSLSQGLRGDPVFSESPDLVLSLLTEHLSERLKK